MFLMAALAKRRTNSDPAVVADPNLGEKLNPMMRLAANLYVQGHSRKKIAKALAKHILSPEMLTRPEDQQYKAAKQKLIRWERSQRFRDYIWQLGLMRVDMASGQILDGLTNKAVRGRVDAARLLLEVTGRHNPKGDPTPTQITIAFSGVPRPNRGAVIAGELVAEEEG